MAAVIQHVLIRLAHRMADQLVANRAAVDVEMLQIGLAAREGRQRHPAEQVQIADAAVDNDDMLDEFGPADRGDAALLFQLRLRRAQLLHCATVMA